MCISCVLCICVQSESVLEDRIEKSPPEKEHSDAPKKLTDTPEELKGTPCNSSYMP